MEEIKIKDIRIRPKEKRRNWEHASKIQKLKTCPRQTRRKIHQKCAGTPLRVKIKKIVRNKESTSTHWSWITIGTQPKIPGVQVKTYGRT